MHGRKELRRQQLPIGGEGDGVNGDEGMINKLAAAGKVDAATTAGLLLLKLKLLLLRLLLLSLRQWRHQLGVWRLRRQ
jgi:hypothetical protein